MSETETKTISYKNPTRTTKGVHTRKAPEGFEWNDRDIKAYTDLDLEPPENLCLFQQRFLKMVDVSKSPIERSVVSLVRLKAPDYLSLSNANNSSKVPERKEYIYFEERWEGNDWRGLPLNPVYNIEGRYDRQFTKPHIDQQTGEIDAYDLDPTRRQTIYYIPYSKKAVDDIIAKSANTDKDSIVFTIKFASEDCPYGAHEQMPNRNQFSYQDFVSSWDQVCKSNYKPSVEKYTEWLNKEKSKDGLSFTPQ